MGNDVRDDFNGQCFELFGGFGYEWRVGGLRGTRAVLKRFYGNPNAVGYAGLV